MRCLIAVNTKTEKLATNRLAGPFGRAQDANLMFVGSRQMLDYLNLKKHYVMCMVRVRVRYSV